MHERVFDSLFLVLLVRVAASISNAILCTEIVAAE